MRYVLIDRFLELEPGKRARAVKCVTRGEEFLRGMEVFPAPLVLEALLQTGGVLARAGTGFSRMSVLGKVESASFPSPARPGDRILLDVAVSLARPEGTMCDGVATVGEGPGQGRVVGRASFLIVFVPEGMAPPPDAAREEQRRRLMRALRIPAVTG